MAPLTTAALAPRLGDHCGTPGVSGSTSSHQATEVLTPAAVALAKASRAAWKPKLHAAGEAVV